MPNLLTIKKGQSVRVTAIRAQYPIDQRILSLGIATDAVLKVCKVAPLGDPIAVEVDGAQIVLRKSEASGIQVEPL
ncbi:MAG: ferrous iron transport protein A [Opitutae bacterium]|nr:ferrous iron transport protein A [Opitutae bacterium]MBC9890004.1 ferrous iron transport protein A [Opitutae bacterium]